MKRLRNIVALIDGEYERARRYDVVATRREERLRRYHKIYAHCDEAHDYVVDYAVTLPRYNVAHAKSYAKKKSALL